MNRMRWMWERYPFEAGEVCCQKTNVGFVDSVWEIFGPLLAGVPSVILLQEAVLDPEELLQILAEQRVTRIVLVPSLLRALLEHAPNLEERVPELKLWTCSGEVLTWELAGRFRKAYPKAKLLNIYGSSEVAADVTWHEVGEEEEAQGTVSVPIGRPINNTQVYVLDRNRNVVPLGVRGEIYVGGDGLALGYWRQPEMTAERFVGNPMAPERSQRLYRTGDLGRWRSTGEIEYLGRMDGEVKVRGMRIELGEIETVLASHRWVEEAVVELSGDGAEQRLVAYVVAGEEGTPSARELRRYVRSKLPEHMVPARFVRLREMPLLPSGKVNRRALKIRGFRAELGEIEAVLSEHPAVRAAAVVVRDEAPGEQRLVAYAVLHPDSLVRAEELRSFLKGKLPDYLLPARFEFLASLPLTSSGQVDRGALPAPASGRQEGEAGYAAPGTELERKLAGIWADVLKLERVSVHDNFFDLGGHSLLAVKLVAHVEKVLGKMLPVISIFQSPTVSELAVLLSTPGSQEKVPGVFLIQPKGSRPAFFCMGAGPLFRPLALRLGLDQPFVGLGTVKSDLRDLPAPFRLEDIATAVVRKLRRLQPRGPYFLGGWCADGVFAYEVAQQLSAQGEKVGLLVLFDAWNPARWNEYSGLERSRIRLRRCVGKIERHLTNLWRLGLRETLADYKWRLKFRSLRHRIWYSYYRFLLATQGQIDNRFRKFFKVWYFTVRDYIPKPYSERILLISSGTAAQRAEDPGLSWSGLLVGKSEFQFVPGGHKRIFLEPNVELLANTLKRCLLDAQDMENESDPTALDLMQEVK
jgi:acyl-coenzyme A synthetase/AMP-(fatty) acid ligase/thioesterase domain-containing protein/acyl carrier protein